MTELVSVKHCSLSWSKLPKEKLWQESTPGKTMTSLILFRIAWVWGWRALWLWVLCCLYISYRQWTPYPLCHSLVDRLLLVFLAPQETSPLELWLEDYGNNGLALAVPLGPACRLWAISETPCLFHLKSSLQWKFLPLEILVTLIAIEMHKWNDKSCILSAIIAIFFYLLESDLCSIDESGFFKVYFPISKVRLFVKWLAQNVILPSPVIFFSLFLSNFKNMS